MIHLLALALGEDPTPLLKKYMETVRSPQGYQVDYTITDSRFKEKGKGKIAILFGKKIHCDVTWFNERYQYISDGSRAIEIDYAEKTYLEWESNGRYSMPPSAVSGMGGEGIPIVIMAGAVEAAFGGAIKLAYETDEVVNGRKAVRAAIKSELGTGKLWITETGELVRLTRVTDTMTGRVTRTYDFFNAKVGTTLSFVAAPPLGYTTFALGRTPFPPAIGEAFPVEGWSRDGKPTALKFERPTALVWVSSKCDISKAMMSHLVKLAKTYPVWLMSADGRPAGADGLPMLTHADSLNLVGPSGSPFVYVVGTDGKITFTNFGFDRRDPSISIAPLEAALKGEKSEE